MPQTIEPGQDGPETPWIVLPYWLSDRGTSTERPLPPATPSGSAVPAGVLSFVCPSLEVIGGAPGVFTPGAETTVAVTVRNYGKGARLDPVTLDLWWSEPTTDFGSLTKKPPMAQEVGIARRGDPNPLVKQMKFTTPADSGPHVCVVVRATVGYQLLPSDPSSDGVPVWPANPCCDRHWAQRNLHAISADSTGGFYFPFTSANGFAKELPFLIRARQVAGPPAEQLARALRARPAARATATISLRPLIGNLDRSERSAAERAELKLAIGADGRLPLLFEGQLEKPLGAGEFAAFEIVQLPAEPKRERKSEPPQPKANRMGSIGVAVIGG